MHRVTLWFDDDENCRQVAVACLDAWWEVHAEATEQVGPFDDLDERITYARVRAHEVGGWHAHQGELQL